MSLVRILYSICFFWEGEIVKHFCDYCGETFEINQDEDIILEEGAIIRCTECDEELYFEKELLEKEDE